jgi:hypothetical protein
MFFWVFPRRQIEFSCKPWHGIYQYHAFLSPFTLHTPHRAFEDGPDSIWRRGNAQKNIYKIQNTAKIWNQEYN